TYGRGAYELTPAVPATIQFATTSYSVSESAGSVSLVLSRTGDTLSPTTVSYSSSDTAATNNCNVFDGRASSSCDYATLVGTVRFAPGETSKTISVLVVDDRYAEGNEQFSLTLSNVVGATMGTPGTATVTINDNDTGTSVNPLSQPGFFVRQHYLDFFSRESDPSGMGFWTDQITSCGSDSSCIELRRIHVSAAFFLSIEFRQTGYLVYRMYKAAYGNVPGTVVPLRFNEFLPDTQEIGLGVVVGQLGWEQLLENNKNQLAANFVSRARFTAAHPTTLSPTQFVNALFENAGVTPSASDLQAAIAEFGAGALNTIDTAARGRALRRVAENSALERAEFNRAFVLAQYFGYLRRNPDDAPDNNLDGYNFWLNKLNQFDGNFINAEMVKAFIDSGEYRSRFGL
ncbi:MAG TPA: Calx-beta domain-containing protein, partial [Pyrinomonadaceae bacterium]|nr:Calx-beta domain-containing protein [Pyrinomonadaceae bacterium]